MAQKALSLLLLLDSMELLLYAILEEKERKTKQLKHQITNNLTNEQETISTDGKVTLE